MTLATEVADLQTRLTEAQRAHARAEGTREAAQAALDSARKELKVAFGVDNDADAQELLEGLHADLQMVIGEMTAALARIGV